MTVPLHMYHIPVDCGAMFVRHTDIEPHRRTIVCIHGLGESGRCFDEIFDMPLARSANIIVPDCIGFGDSSAADNGAYDFTSQVLRIWQCADSLGIEQFAVVGHSVGGDLAVMCASVDKWHAVTACVNIEGDITQYDDFITRLAVQALREGRFDTWFTDEFIEKTVRQDWGIQSAACRRYYTALKQCQSEAFTSYVRELMQRKVSAPGSYTSELGWMYYNLSIPKTFYCGGTIDPRSLDFCRENGCAVTQYDQAGHWVMIDAADKFYSDLETFLDSVYHENGERKE